MTADGPRDKHFMIFHGISEFPSSLRMRLEAVIKYDKGYYHTNAKILGPPADDRDSS